MSPKRTLSITNHFLPRLRSIRGFVLGTMCSYQIHGMRCAILEQNARGIDQVCKQFPWPSIPSLLQTRWYNYCVLVCYSKRFPPFQKHFPSNHQNHDFWVVVEVQSPELSIPIPSDDVLAVFLLEEESVAKGVDVHPLPPAELPSSRSLTNVLTP